MTTTGAIPGPGPVPGDRRGRASLNPAGIGAVWRRELGSLLGNPLGYVFILAFVLATATWMFWFKSDEFFARNISDLGMLAAAMPVCLAMLLPALAMGSWAREREQGTEELLLTLPLSVLDALLGKFLAVSSYFTIALLFSLTNVGALMWLGDPDMGLVTANYVGWWLSGLAFAAIGVLASVLVSIPAVAFVIGVAGSLGMLALALWGGWYDDFDRGVIPVFNVIAALGVIVAALGTGALLLAARRWRPGSGAMVAAQVFTLLFGVALAINLARWAERKGAYADVSVEGISSLAPASIALIKGIDRPVTITVFLSESVPPDQELKRKEIQDKALAIERANDARIKVRFRPVDDALGANGLEATREFGLKARKMKVKDVTGNEDREVFLGAAVSSGGSTQVIEYFDPGLSVEYELVRAMRAVAAAKKRVLGIVETDLKIAGGFDYQAMMSGGGAIPEWELVKEWKKQYEVRPVVLDADVPSEVEVLVVPQPSSLTQPQLEKLHDYIWAGRPALLLEDPVPVSDLRAELIPSRPKKSQNPYGAMGGADDSAPKKGDIKTLWRALGLDFDEDKLVVSDYIPSHAFRGQLPNSFVWVDRAKGGQPDETEATKGADQLLFLVAGQIRIASDKFSSLSVTPLIEATEGAPWDIVALTDVVDIDPYQGRVMFTGKPARMRTLRTTDAPALAVQVTGRMQAAYPVVDASASAEPKAGEVGPPVPERKTGVVSPKPVNVIVVADIDGFSEIFYQFYRNPGGRFSDDQMRELTTLRNVQFIGNAVDTLFADQSLTALRTRRPERRPLARLETMLMQSQEERRKATEAAFEDFETEKTRIESDFSDKLAKIDQREDLDEVAKAHAKARAEEVGIQQKATTIADANRRYEQKLAGIASVQRQDVKQARLIVRAWAIGGPAALLLLLVLAVFIRRVLSEGAYIPASRQRAA